MDGTLVIADIGGYTRYLTGVELEHSQDILADIIGLIAERLGESLTVENIEGDAVFCWRPDGGSFDLVATIDGCYLSFTDRIRSIYRLSTCGCEACRSVPMLDLKFVAHHGTFLEQILAGRHSLLGPDIILVHRLLKNHVKEETGLNGYAFLTEDCVRAHGLDAAELVPHSEDYEDVGHVPGRLRDLELMWRERQGRRRVYVSPEDALVGAEVEVAGEPEDLWEILSVPTNWVGWFVGLDSVEEHNPGGIRGIGTVSHCVHGDIAMRHEVLDWQPPRYATERVVGERSGSWIVTAELTPLGDRRTRMGWRLRVEKLPEGVEEKTIAAIVAPVIEQSLAGLASRAEDDSLIQHKET
jgi:hypothetical protein